MVVASLCHDIGKAISVPGHPQIAAAILKPYVRPEVHQMILVHQDFQGAHYYHHFGGDPHARGSTATSLTPDEWKLAEQFADDWDQKAFDPDYDTLPLEHFEDARPGAVRQRQAVLAAALLAVRSPGPALGLVEEGLQLTAQPRRERAHRAPRHPTLLGPVRGRDRVAHDEHQPAAGGATWRPWASSPRSHRCRPG